MGVRMTGLTLAFVIVVLAIGAFLIFTGPKRYAVPFVVLMYLGLYAGIADIMGRSKPILIPKEEMAVLDHWFDEGSAIHVWTLFEGAPLAIRLPWSMEEAKKLRKAARDAEGQPGSLRMRRGVPEGEAMFYAAPPEPLPPKQ